MPSDVVSACDDYIQANNYRHLRAGEIDEYPACKLCFPDREIDVDESELLLPNQVRGRARIHRVEGSEGTLWTPSDSDPDHSLANALQSESVTSVADLPEDVLGGDA